jgi:hypothetical protein
MRFFIGHAAAYRAREYFLPVCQCDLEYAFSGNPFLNHRAGKNTLSE